MTNEAGMLAAVTAGVATGEQILWACLVMGGFVFCLAVMQFWPRS